MLHIIILMAFVPGVFDGTFRGCTV